MVGKVVGLLFVLSTYNVMLFVERFLGTDKWGEKSKWKGKTKTLESS